jgi:ribosomal protein S21
MGREQVFDELRKRRYYQKPSKVRREKSKEARFNAMLKQRHADD